MTDLVQQLQHLASLEPDWDSYGAQPISGHAIDRCRSIHFSPTSDGGIQIELTDGAVEVEVIVGPDGSLRGVSMDRAR